jgi:hypothetical protein
MNAAPDEAANYVRELSPERRASLKEEQSVISPSGFEQDGRRLAF